MTSKSFVILSGIIVAACLAGWLRFAPKSANAEPRMESPSTGCCEHWSSERQL